MYSYRRAIAQLYRRLCPSVGPVFVCVSVCVCMYVCVCVYVCVYVSKHNFSQTPLHFPNFPIHNPAFRRVRIRPNYHWWHQWPVQAGPYLWSSINKNRGWRFNNQWSVKIICISEKGNSKHIFWSNSKWLATTHTYRNSVLNFLSSAV